MPIGELFINGDDAYIEWGMSMDTTSLSTLMTPAPNKDLVENKSRLQDGKRVITSNPKKDERTIALSIQFSAANETEFFARYVSFCEVLDAGILNIRTKYQPNVEYKMIYLSCQQFTQFMRGIANFVLRLCEPNPADRNFQP